MFNITNYYFNIFAFPPLIVALMVLLMGIVIFLYNRRSPVNFFFLLSCCSLSVWLSGMALCFLSRHEWMAVACYRYYTFLGILFIGPNIYFFVRAVTKTLDNLKKYILLSYSLVFLFYYLGLRTNLLIIGVKRYYWGLYPQYGPFSYLFLSIFFSYAIIVLHHLWIHQNKPAVKVERKQLRLLFFAYLFGYLGALDFLPTYGIEMYSFGYIPIAYWAFIVCYAILKYKFLIITPEIAANEIILLIPDFLILIDPLGRIIKVNKAVEEGLGYGKEELIGEKIHIVLDDRNKAKLLLRNLVDKGSVKNEEVMYVSRTGKKIPVLFSAVSICENTMVQGMVCVAQDITKIKEAREHVSNAYKELSSTQSQLVQSEKMSGIGQLAAGIAHEINNPTGYVKANLVSLREDVEIMLKTYEAYEKFFNSVLPEDTEKQKLLKEKFTEIISISDIAYLKKDFVELIDESLDGIDRIQSIVSNLKEYSNPIGIQLSSIDINSEIDKAITYVWEELKDQCEVVKDYGLIPFIEADPICFAQVIINLLINARQAIIEKGCITVRTYLLNSSIFIEISDDGIGMSQDQVNKIFTPFYTTKEKGRGTGLGLSIVYEIVKKYKWDITVKSKPNIGTIFKIKLPLDKK